MKSKFSLLILSSVLFACEPDRIEPKIDCATANVSVIVTNVVGSSCIADDGSISVAGSGGESPYKFSISGNDPTEDSVFTDLAPGNYSITIQDVNNCSNTIEATVNNSAGFNIEVVAEGTSCTANTGTISVTTVGGKAPFQFQLGTGPLVSDSVFTELAEGSYTITAIDANQCHTTAPTTISKATNLSVTFTIQDAGCGTSNGRITANVNGGVEPYQYKFGSGAFGSSNVFNNLSTGNYTLTIQDASGCDDSGSAKVLSGVKFSTSISSIIASNCATGSCHGGSVSPNLSGFENIKQNAAAIKNETQSKRMPKGGSITQSQIDAIACWVNDGAPNN